MLQPQGSQNPIYGLKDADNFQLPPEFLQLQPGHTSNANITMLPAQNNGARGDAGSFPKDYGTVPNSLPAPFTSPPAVQAERPALRRSRATDTKINRVRPSPLMKPIQSPKGSASGSSSAWQGRKRDQNQHASPSLGALESLSNTMQEASSLSMPSPALSPATLAINKRGGVSAPNRPPSGELSPSLRSTKFASGESNASIHNLSTKSPSPIELAQNSDQTQHSSQPATPGSLMGLVYAPESSKAQRKAEPSHVQTPSHPSHAQQHMSQPLRTYQQPSDLSSLHTYPNQNAVHAVTASALINAARPHANLMYPNSSSQPKFILPSGLSSEDRSTWLGFRHLEQGGLEQRRSSHKAAEQKRRDSLKHCFDELRALLPAITIDDNVPGGSVLGADGTKEDRIAEGLELEESSKAENEAEPTSASGFASPDQCRDANRIVAKVLLLRHSNEYLVRLQRRIERRDLALHSLSEEVVRLRSLLNQRGISTDGEDAKVSNEMSSLSIEPEENSPAIKPEDAPVGSESTEKRHSTPKQF